MVLPTLFKCAATENDRAGVIPCGNNQLTSSVKVCRYLILLLWIKTFEDGPCGEGDGDVCCLGLGGKGKFILSALRTDQTLSAVLTVPCWARGIFDQSQNKVARLSHWFC